MSALTLFYAPGSSSLAPHIALNEAGATFETRRFSLADKQTRTPEFLAVNPAGKVPALLIDGRLLTEVAGILFYIARRFPEARLMPAGGIEAEAQTVSWMSFVASTVHPAFRTGADAVREAFTIAEARLAGRAWTVGDAYSIADIHLFRLPWRTRDLVNVRAGGFPALAALYDRVHDRPAVRRTMAAEKLDGYELPVGAAPKA